MASNLIATKSLVSDISQLIDEYQTWSTDPRKTMHVKHKLAHRALDLLEKLYQQNNGVFDAD